MKQPLCVTTLVFGSQYQDFIPLFIYSLLRAYPEYYPLIFVHGSIGIKVHQRLELLHDLGRFRIIENYLTWLNWSGQRARAVRWLLFDGEFLEYEAVYTGDIDMLMMPEAPKLHEQHNAHCQIIGLPYSNVLRPTIIRKIRRDPLNLSKRLLRVGLRNAIRSLAYSQVEVRKLTGLHYMKTDDYFPAVLPKMIEFMAMLASGRGKSLLDQAKYVDGFSNESMLLDLVLESGLGLPPIAEDMLEPIDLEYKRYTSPDFRPHHGIHLGMFRTPFNPHFAPILRLESYREYYYHYKTMKEDPLFQKLLLMSPKSIRLIFARMEEAYKTYTSCT